MDDEAGGAAADQEDADKPVDDEAGGAAAEEAGEPEAGEPEAGGAVEEDAMDDAYLIARMVQRLTFAHGRTICTAGGRVYRIRGTLGEWEEKFKERFGDYPNPRGLYANEVWWIAQKLMVAEWEAGGAVGWEYVDDAELIATTPFPWTWPSTDLDSRLLDAGQEDSRTLEEWKEEYKKRFGDYPRGCYANKVWWIAEELGLVAGKAAAGKAAMGKAAAGKAAAGKADEGPGGTLEEWKEKYKERFGDYPRGRYANKMWWIAQKLNEAGSEEEEADEDDRDDDDSSESEEEVDEDDRDDDDSTKSEEEDKEEVGEKKRFRRTKAEINSQLTIDQAREARKATATTKKRKAAVTLNQVFTIEHIKKKQKEQDKQISEINTKLDDMLNLMKQMKKAE